MATLRITAEGENVWGAYLDDKHLGNVRFGEPEQHDYSDDEMDTLEDLVRDQFKVPPDADTLLPY